MPSPSGCGWAREQAEIIGRRLEPLAEARLIFDILDTIANRARRSGIGKELGPMSVNATLVTDGYNRKGLNMVLRRVGKLTLLQSEAWE